MACKIGHELYNILSSILHVGRDIHIQVYIHVRQLPFAAKAAGDALCQANAMKKYKLAAVAEHGCKHTLCKVCRSASFCSSVR